MNAALKVLVLTSVLFWVSNGMAVKYAVRDTSKEDVVTLRVRGLGPDHDAALKDALRKAIERGGHLEVYSQSESADYTLVRDTVLAQASGLIKDYKIVGEGEDAIGGYFVEIVAKVDRRIIDATWGQVKILLQQMGKPKILVNFVERINDLAMPGREEHIEADSLLGNKIEELLVEKGFELVDKNQIERLKRDQLEKATISQDTAAVKQLATELGAQMFLVGFARASGPQLTDAYGVRLYMWETDVTLKALWSETGQILFNRSEVGTRGGSRTPGPPGAKDAIAKAGDKLAYACLQAILEKWSRTAVGGGKIVLEVKNLDFKQMLMIQDGLQQIEGIREVNREWHKPTAKFELVTVHSAEKLAEILCEVQFPGFVLDVEDQKFNTIEASLQKAARASKACGKTPPATAPPAVNRSTTKPAATAPSTRPADTRPATEM
jgi:hypothetical protein